MGSLLSKDRYQSVLANQHLRFVPKKKMNFDYLSGDGPLSLVFEASAESQRVAKYRPNAGKVYLAGLIPALYMAWISLSVEHLMLTYAAMIVPSIYSFYDSSKAKKQYMNQVKRLFLLKNGD